MILSRHRTITRSSERQRTIRGNAFAETASYFSARKIVEIKKAIANQLIHEAMLDLFLPLLSKDVIAIPLANKRVG